MDIWESGEDYLEIILVIEKKNGFVRSVDVAEELGYTKASVSVAMKALIKKGYVVMNDKKEILLTNQGREIAENMYERHLFLTKLLENFGVCHETAEKDACKIEHYLSKESYEAIKKNALKNKGSLI